MYIDGLCVYITCDSRMFLRTIEYDSERSLALLART